MHYRREEKGGGGGGGEGIHCITGTDEDVVLDEQLRAVAGVDAVVQRIVVVVVDMAGSEALQMG